MQKKKNLIFVLVIFLLVLTPLIFAEDNSFVVDGIKYEGNYGKNLFVIEDTSSKGDIQKFFSFVLEYVSIFDFGEVKLSKEFFSETLFPEDKNPDLVVSENILEEFEEKEKVRIIVKSNEEVKFIKNTIELTTSEIPLGKTISITGESIEEKEENRKELIEGTKEVIDNVREIEPVEMIVGKSNFSMPYVSQFSRAFSMTGNVVSEKGENIEGKEIIEEVEEQKLFLDVNTKNPVEVKQIVDEYTAIEIDKRSFNQLQKQIEIGEVIIDEPFGLLIEESLEITNTRIAHEEFNLTGEGVKICVIDTGVNHEVLNLEKEVDVLGYNVIDNNYDISDKHGHGTSIMSVLTKVSPNSTYYVVKAIDENGVGYSSDIVSGLDWCFNQEVDIYSLSLGAGNFENYCPEDFVAEKVNEIVNSGFLVFAATGNNGNIGSITSPACSGLSTPVMSSTKEDRISTFSNSNYFTLLSAPGEEVSVLNKYGGELSASGTSISTAIVSGIAALLLEGRNLEQEEIETLLVKTGKVIEDSTGKYSRIDSLNALNGAPLNSLNPREFPTYEELIEMAKINKGEDLIFLPLATCETSEECGGNLCIEGTCAAACNSTFDNSRCSDDENAYYASASGTCARDNGGTYTCDKDEVAESPLSIAHFSDCYDAFFDEIPDDEGACDSDVAPGYTADGICSWDGGTPGVNTVDCDLDEVCIKNGNYTSDCSVCGYTSEYSCDSNVGTSYTQDGICVQGGICDTVDVCYNGTGFYGTMTQCVDGDECDSNVNPDFASDGAVCNTYSLGCVVEGSRTNGQSCCHPSNCESQVCTANVCTIAMSDCVPLIGETFSVKNSTGDLCFELNSTGKAVLYGDMINNTTCGAAPTGSFEFKSNSGQVLGWINASCYACFSTPVYDSQGFDLSGNYYVKDVSDKDLMALSSLNVSFAGKACYDYNSGSPQDIGGS